jgi:hypothetical protein
MKSFRTRRGLLILATMVLGLGLALVWQLGRIALWPVAIYSGWLLLALVLVLTFFNARKKLPFLPLLNASTWMQAHIYLGWLACFIFGLHVRLRIPFGLWLSRWLPPRLVLSGESLVYERIPALRHQLAEEAREIVRRAETETHSSSLADLYLSVINPYFLRVPPPFASLLGDESACHHVKLELESARRYLNEAEKVFASQLADLIEAKRNLDQQLAGQRLLKLWLFVHIPLTYGLLVLIAAHVWLVLHYSHRL